MIRIKNETESLFRDFSKIKIDKDVELKNYFRFDEIDYWDLISPIICYHYLPAAINNTKVPYLKRGFRAKIAFIKFCFKLTMIRIKKFAGPSSNRNIDGSSKILFLNFSPYMSKEVLIPVAESISKIKGEASSALFLSDFFANKEDNKYFLNVEHTYCDDLCSSSLFQLSKVTGELKKRCNTVRIKIKQSNFFANKGISDVNVNFMLSWIFSYHMPKLVHYVDSANRLLRKNNFNSVISSDFSDPRPRAYVAVANKKNIPTVDIQFGLLDLDNCNYEWGFCRSNKICVWGENSKLELIRAKIKEDRIFITGSPKHDYISKKYIFPDLPVEKILKKKKKHLILFASTHEPIAGLDTTNPGPIRNAKELVLKLAREFINIEFMVKPHPLEDEEELQKLFSSLNNVIFIKKNQNIRESIEQCDTFIGLGTAATVDAILLGKNVICPCPEGFKLNDIFLNSGCIIKAEDFFELKYAVRGVLSSDTKSSRELNKFIAKFAYKCDGESAKRVANLCI